MILLNYDLQEIESLEIERQEKIQESVLSELDFNQWVEEQKQYLLTQEESEVDL